jgi:hypothetical protein
MAAAERMLYLIREQNLSEYDAWNSSSVLLVNASKVIKEHINIKY